MNIRECPLCGNELTSVETHYNEISGACRCGLEFRIKGDDPIGTWNNRPVEDELKRMLNEELSKGERHQGHWIERFDEDSRWLQCSECTGCVDIHEATNYCPSCGAKMGE